MEQYRKLRVGITHGDINGVSYEVILKALGDARITEICTPIIYGSAKIAAFYRKNIEDSPAKLYQIESPEDAEAEQINIINIVPEDIKIVAVPVLTHRMISETSYTEEKETFIRGLLNSIALPTEDWAKP